VTGYTALEDYVATPRSTDPATLLRERSIAIRWLLSQLDAADDVIADREKQINDLYVELLGR
jgi:hypothetical protein